MQYLAINSKMKMCNKSATQVPGQPNFRVYPYAYISIKP